jgi:AmmeMemoRadiSam system protein A
MDLSAEQKRLLMDVARQTIRQTLGRRMPPMQIPDDPGLRQPAGCFVTLHTLHTHRLRGCVGRLDTQQPLIEVVQQSAESALQDPRFMSYPVCLHELPELELEITVIFPLRPADNPLDFELSEGIYLTCNSRSGCFLPQVAQETGWNREQLLERLCTEKLGVSADAWKDPSARLMKFSTLIIGPEPFENAHPLSR